MRFPPHNFSLGTSGLCALIFVGLLHSDERRLGPEAAPANPNQSLPVSQPTTAMTLLLLPDLNFRSRSSIALQGALRGRLN